MSFIHAFYRANEPQYTQKLPNTVSILQNHSARLKVRKNLDKNAQCARQTASGTRVALDYHARRLFAAAVT
jgi:hypothetical protein